jgi:hypothetical protein
LLTTPLGTGTDGDFAQGADHFFQFWRGAFGVGVLRGPHGFEVGRAGAAMVVTAVRNAQRAASATAKNKVRVLLHHP